MNIIKTWPPALLLPLALAFALQDGSCRRRRPTTTSAANSGQARQTPTPAGGGELRKETTSLPSGNWGGQHVRLDANDSGAAVEFDCAHGTVDQRIELDGEGRFDLRGTFEVEAGGPATDATAAEEGVANSNAAGRGRPARYAGRVAGRTMTLTVTLAGADRPFGTFTLTHGAQARLNKCL